jgi:hypothetical protein
VRKYFTNLQADVMETKAFLSATVLEMSDAEYRRRHATLDGQLAVFQTLLSVEQGRAPALQAASPAKQDPQ